MRTLSDIFKKELKTGQYKELTDTVISDADLDFQIRNSYINIYYKGNSILKLDENHQYSIHEKFVKNSNIDKTGIFDINQYLTELPKIKENINKVKSKRPSLEIEYEQLIIRSNNNVNSEIFITDRQFADKENGEDVRFDLSGFTWNTPRKREQSVPLTFIEVKYGLNNDIKNLDVQLSSYYDKIKSKINEIAEETQNLLKIKADLGLFGYKEPDVLKTLKVSNKLEETIFIIALIDYNPNSKLLNLEKLKNLKFSEQIRIFKCGLAVWNDYLKPIL